jgi:hypothetical protein
VDDRSGRRVRRQKHGGGHKEREGG